MRYYGLLLTIIFSYNINAQVMRGPLSRSLGGSGRAGIEASESALLNPALIPLAVNHEVNFFYGDGYLDRKEHQQFWGLGAIDNGGDVMLPGSLHYIRTRDTAPNSGAVSNELWHFGIGQLAGNSYSFGFSGYYLVSEPDGARRRTQWNGSFGFLYMFSRDIGLAYVLDNILDASSSMPIHLRKTMQQSVGIMYSFADYARARFDVTRNEQLNPDKKMAYQAGFESAAHEYAIIRMGAKWDNLAEQNFLTAGVGFNGPRLKLDYSFEKNVKHTSGALHSVDMRIPF